MFSTALIVRQAYSQGFTLVDENGYIRPFGDHYNSDLCLATIKNSDNADIVSLEVCQDAENFKWQHEASNLVRQTGTNKCWRIASLDVDNSQTVFMGICDENDKNEQFTLQQNDGRLVPTHKVPKGDQVCLRAQAKEAQDLRYGGCQETNFGQLNLAQMSLINDDGQIKLFNGRYGNLQNAPPPKCLASKSVKSGKGISLETCTLETRMKWSYNPVSKQIQQLNTNFCFQVDGNINAGLEDRAPGIKLAVCDSSSDHQQFDVSQYGRITPSQSSSSDLSCLRARAKSYSTKSRLAFGGCHEVSWGSLTLPSDGTCDSNPCENGGVFTGA